MMRALATLVATSALVLPACSAGPAALDDPDEVEDGVAVPEGKEDDFFSLSAREFVVEGRAQVTIEDDLSSADEATKLARVHQLIGLKHIALAWFLTEYLIEKEDEDENKEFGGFGGMAKAGSYEELDIRALNGRTYEFTFRHLIAGRNNLMSKLPLQNGPGGSKQMVLTVGNPSNEEMAKLETNHEWYRDPPWDAWDPAMVGADRKTDLLLTVTPEVASTDAWFDYQPLLADGKLTIDVHFGWDYHDAYHVKHASQMFTWLKERGFTAPVASFDKLTRTSGAFKRTIEANGRSVAVEVRIFYGKTGAVTDPDTDAGGRVLEDDMRESLASRDAIVYSGHSGPLYGFALANWKKTEEGDFDDSDMETVAMPAERYQVVLAEGCDTYMIGEAFKRNPAKPNGAFLDIITTTSFSDAGSPAAVQDFIGHLVELDSQGRHRPRTLKSLLSNLDSNSFGFHPMYGIHGIDDAPTLHPYARADLLCSSCSRNSDCGGVGNQCLTVGSSGRRCAAACTDDRGCPSGFSCRAVASQSAGVIYGRACVPQALRCE